MSTSPVYHFTFTHNIQGICSPEELAALRTHPDFVKLEALAAQGRDLYCACQKAQEAKRAAWAAMDAARSAALDRRPLCEYKAFKQTHLSDSLQRKQQHLRWQVDVLLGKNAGPAPTLGADPALTLQAQGLREAVDAAWAAAEKAITAEMQTLAAAEAAYAEALKVSNDADFRLWAFYDSSPIGQITSLQVDHW